MVDIWNGTGTPNIGNITVSYLRSGKKQTWLNPSLRLHLKNTVEEATLEITINSLKTMSPRIYLSRPFNTPKEEEYFVLQGIDGLQCLTSFLALDNTCFEW